MGLPEQQLETRLLLHWFSPAEACCAPVGDESGQAMSRYSPSTGHPHQSPKTPPVPPIEYHHAGYGIDASTFHPSRAWPIAMPAGQRHVHMMNHIENSANV